MARTVFAFLILLRFLPWFWFSLYFCLFFTMFIFILISPPFSSFNLIACSMFYQFQVCPFSLTLFLILPLPFFPSVYPISPTIFFSPLFSSYFSWTVFGILPPLRLFYFLSSFILSVSLLSLSISFRLIFFFSSSLLFSSFRCHCPPPFPSPLPYHSTPRFFALVITVAAAMITE